MEDGKCNVDWVVVCMRPWPWLMSAESSMPVTNGGDTSSLAVCRVLSLAGWWLAQALGSSVRGTASLPMG
jgi:hypothetical protein